MRHLLVATLLLALLATVDALASTYQWRDDQGVTHFTDDPDRIPARYLKRVRELDSVSAEKKPAPRATVPDVPAAVAAPARESVASAPAGGASQDVRLAVELKRLREGLEAKKKELDRLHHKWTVAKGRNPSEEEVGKYEKKRAEGKATYKDNPYVNKRPLSSPAPARAAYYAKLAELRKDEDRVRQLEQELRASGK